MLNPWAANKALRETISALVVANAKLESELRIERNVIASLRAKLANAHIRDPKTGRILPKGK